jgi:hypothetical protein
MDTELVGRPVAKSNRPKKSTPKRDRFLLDLPPEYREPLQKIQAATGRPMTVTGQMALELLFRVTGVPFTPNWPEIQLPSPPPARRSTS